MPDYAVGGVELGPLPMDGYDWYRIRYGFADAGHAAGGAGWVAYGPSASPWLAPPAGDQSDIRTFAGTAGTGDGVVGPVEIGDYYGVRWAAVGQACPLVVSINDVAVVSTTVDGFADGDVRLFQGYPEVVGTFDIEIETECAWTLSHGTYEA
jgi:hypothetical protein